MRTLHLLLLVALTTTAESRCGGKNRSKRDVLVRTKRRWVLSTIELTEELDGDYPIEISQMFNNMTGEHEFHISGQGVELEPKNAFYIEPDTGYVCATRRIDREQYPGPFHIKFDIMNKYTKKLLDTQLTFDVALRDINDNAPEFQSNQITAYVKESWTGEHLPFDLYMNDKDLKNTVNSTISVSVISQSPQEPKIGIKQINNSLAHLTSSGCFDYDKIKMYQVIIQAKDHGKLPLSSTATVTLNIVDSNTNPPKFRKKEYYARVNESTILNNVLRVAVDDQDKPQTPGWRAKYFFIKGNEENTYKIETDPTTNEGILSVIKGMDYENKKSVTLQIGVENEEPLFVCKGKKNVPQDGTQETAIITLSLIDVNDPPYFKKKVEDLRLNEEERPGNVLFKPEVNDTDSDPGMIRFELLEDPAKWVKINKKTGELTSIQKMDRESPFLNGTGTYKVLIGAIDDGKPPATGTCTVFIHLRDINDNVPQLANKSVVMCGNKVNEVKVLAVDADAPPFSGPFFFSLRGDVKVLEKRWKLEPFFGIESTLISLKTLPYGNYSVPLEIRDQQNTIANETLQVILCDCGEKEVCRSKKPVSVSLGSPAIGILFLGLLLFLLLLFIFMCTCGKEFKNIPVLNEEGKQTLIMYNQEGGASECKTQPNMFLTSTKNMTMTDSPKKGTMQMSQMAPLTAQDIDGYNSSVFNLMNSNMSLGMQRPSVRRHGGHAMNSTWGSTRNSNFQGDYSRRSRSVSVRSNQHVEDQLIRRLNMIDENHSTYSQQEPHNYAYEGKGSICQSLDQLSLSNLGDDLTFLNTLGPKFDTLGAICQKTFQGKSISLKGTAGPPF